MFRDVIVIIFESAIIIGGLIILIAEVIYQKLPNKKAIEAFAIYEQQLIERGPHGKPVGPPMMWLRDRGHTKDRAFYRSEMDRLEKKYPWRF